MTLPAMAAPLMAVVSLVSLPAVAVTAVVPTVGGKVVGFPVIADHATETAPTLASSQS
ncbi:hypothetical protein [Pseudomonas sp. AU8050]|uniref:hypothetical protein n=1 Tax=Pseudomonas sp. AU8050 TaxID=2681497 RepID=UPI00140B9FF3|nr:hypothetical protein [Pseudomonas sp. AU8050]NHC53110.1 hypothetical protein [Pseudomonas sp. AU8050]